MKIKILKALSAELKNAIEKEKKSIKEFELKNSNEDVSASTIVKLATNISKDSGYTNGIIGAIDIIKKIYE